MNQHFFDLTIIPKLMPAAHFIAKKESALAGSKERKRRVYSFLRQIIEEAKVPVAITTQS